MHPIRSFLPLVVALSLVAPAAWSKQTAGATAGEPKPPASGFQLSLTTRGRLGVHAISMTEELRTFFGAPRDAGVLIGRVEPDSPAAKAGLRVGDVLTRVAGRTVTDAADMLGALAGKKQGDALELTVIRNKRTHTLSARLDRDAASAPFDLEGLWQAPWWRFSWPGGDRIERLEERLRELEQKLRQRR